MSARIAPDPISTTAATASDYRPRQQASEQPVVKPSAGSEHAAVANTNEPRINENEEAAASAAEVLPPLPKPPAPPGTMFAAAVLAGALSPTPQSPQELFLRLGGAEWSPPESDLHLRDSSA